MRVSALSFALAALLYTGTEACSCVGGVSLTDQFLSDTYETIGVFCNGVPSRSFPDVDNQFESIEWKLDVQAIYKGDCSLAPTGPYSEGSVITVTSGANSALCGVDLSGSCYLLGISSSRSVALCGPYIKTENLTPEQSAELEANNQCSSGTQVPAATPSPIVAPSAPATSSPCRSPPRYRNGRDFRVLYGRGTYAGRGYGRARRFRSRFRWRS